MRVVVRLVDLLFVTKDNVDPYLKTKSRYEGSDKAQKYIKG